MRDAPVAATTTVGVQALPRPVDLAPVDQAETRGNGVLRLLYAIASHGQPQSVVVSGGIAYAAEASYPDALVSWPIDAPELARSYVLGTPGSSNSAPLASPDGRLLVSAHQSQTAGSELTFTVSELPDLRVVCRQTLSGPASAEGFAGWTEYQGRLTAWYRSGAVLYALDVSDCQVLQQVALGTKEEGPPDSVTPTIAPDGSLWTSYLIEAGGAGAESQHRTGTARFDLQDGVTPQCIAPVGHGLDGYGTPVIVPSGPEVGHQYAVMIAANDGVVSRLEPDCTVTWSRRVLHPSPDVDAYGMVHQGLASSATLGLLYVADNSAWVAAAPPGPDAGSVIALDAASGEEIWRWQDPSRPQAFAPFVVGDYVFVRSYDASATLPPRLTLLDAATGQQIDSIDLSPPSEPGAGSGPISAKLLCTSSVCIVASANGPTSAPGWWFVVAFNDLRATDESVPFSGDEGHQNAAQPQVDLAGYYCNSAIIWHADGTFEYERTPLGERVIDRDAVMVEASSGPVAISVLDWLDGEEVLPGSAANDPAGIEAGAHIRLAPVAGPTSVRLRLGGVPAATGYLIELTPMTGPAKEVVLNMEEGVMHLELDLDSALDLRVLAAIVA